MQEDSNKMLGPLVKSLPKVQWLIDVEVPMNVSITLASFLPKDIDVYYTYKGSLTTPPCSEVVTWILFSTPVQISFKQVMKFSVTYFSSISCLFIKIVKFYEQFLLHGRWRNFECFRTAKMCWRTILDKCRRLDTEKFM